MRWRARARRFLPFIIAATGGFLAAYLIVALFVFPSEIVPNDEIVPDVIGLSYDEAAQKLTASGFSATAGERRFHVSAPAQTVLEQSPPAGSRELRGTRVALAVSGGQQRAPVPVVTGMSREEATQTLRGAGFDVGSIVQQPSNLPRGQVTASDPAANARVLVPSTVNLVISSGPSAVTVPDVVGRSYPAARSQLEELGLRIGNVTIDNLSLEPANTVLSQAPEAGQLVPTGVRISLTVSGRTR